MPEQNRFEEKNTLRQDVDSMMCRRCAKKTHDNQSNHRKIVTYRWKYCLSRIVVVVHGGRTEPASGPQTRIHLSKTPPAADDVPIALLCKVVVVAVAEGGTTR